MRRLPAVAMLAVAGATVGILVIVGSLVRPSTRLPNVVFWLVDTCRADHLSTYGHPAQTSPFLSELAAEGVLFEQCRSQAPWTKPSMAAVLTGRYPAATGVRGLLDRLDNDFTTLPESLRVAGYRTYGLSANPIMGRMSNYQQGFDRFFELQQSIRLEDPVPLASGSASRLVDEAVTWLDAQGPQPFFLYLHTMDPHEQYKPAPEFLRQFADPAGEEAYRRDWKALASAGPAVIANLFTPERFARAGVDPGPFIDYGRRLYDGDVLATDTAMRRLWDHLTRLGLTKDTVFIVTSDHGEEFFEHGGTSHGYALYDELLRVPLVIRAPGRIPRGARVSTPVRSIDIYPTLLDLVGLPIPEGLDGRTLRPLIDGQPPRDPAKTYAEKRQATDPTAQMFPIGVGYAVLAPPWKLILNPELPGGRSLAPQELYRIDTDPGETRNLVDDEPARVAAMAADLRQWVETTTARAPQPRRPTTPLPPQALESLRQLGYLDASK